MEKEIQEKLLVLAADMLKKSYAPYSGFCVGAALLDKDGRIFTGCNIENAAYTPSNCAERTAFFKAVSEGSREFQAIVIVGGRAGSWEQFCPPCGVCRQVMREFCSPDSFEIVLGTKSGKRRIMRLGELLPESFGPEQLS